MDMIGRGDRVVLTLDVECDADGGPTWRYSSPATFHGVSHGLGDVLAGILQRTGAVATLLVSNVVLRDQKSVDILRSLERAELGSHLHGDFLPPDPRYEDPSGAITFDNQCEYPEDVERLKLHALGDLFHEAFGKTPTAFRAGRWSASGRTARLLTEMGYVADSSVSPHIHWTDRGRSVDFRHAPEQPYHPDPADIALPGTLPIWELPVSILKPRWWAGRARWLRPSNSDFGRMKRVAVELSRRYPHPRTLVAMLHNNELTPFASPHSRDPERAATMARRLESFLGWAADQGVDFLTMTEAATACGY